MHIDRSSIRNVEIFKLGLSNRKLELDIKIGPNSGTLHSPGKVPLTFSEKKELTTLDAWVTAWDFYVSLESAGYLIYFEEGLTEIKTREDFLAKCGNFAYSANIVITKKELTV